MLIGDIEYRALLGLDRGQFRFQLLDGGVDFAQPHGQIAQVGRVLAVQLEDVE
ncbi:hypothetical protein [Pseudogulbenkiania sp. MAI-1]|uniref:hypothetical protein n=1 Tax=Pseudogulbenkiania sp. MAI-1 TaxID=990370 RepID=UPI001E3D4454|nr:hypothetical protein [Pseudogulbenkiania sp. MAI-1]